MDRDGIVASEVEAKPVEWLWKERIPKGAISVVAGKPDQGKGLFASHLAAEVTGQGGNVLYSAMEDDPARMTVPRLEAAGADLDRVLLWRFILPDQLDELAEKVAKHDIRLVIIDPFAASLGKGVSRFTDSVRAVTNPLTEMVEDGSGLSVVIIEHALKRATQASGDPLTAIGGTGSGLAAAARMAYLFGKDPKDADRRLLASVKHNLREKPKALAFEVDAVPLDTGMAPFLIGQGETSIDASQLLAKGSDATPGRPPNKRAAAAEWLTQLLYKQGGPMKAKAVYEDARHVGNMSSQTLRRAADDMGVIRKPPAGGPNCTWELPPAVRKALDVAKARQAAQKQGGSA